MHILNAHTHTQPRIHTHTPRIIALYDCGCEFRTQTQAHTHQSKVVVRYGRPACLSVLRASLCICTHAHIYYIQPMIALAKISVSNDIIQLYARDNHVVIKVDGCLRQTIVCTLGCVPPMMSMQRRIGRLRQREIPRCNARIVDPMSAAALRRLRRTTAAASDRCRTETT